jgi:hypothetical protein
LKFKDDRRLVIVTAANSKYYGELQATLFYIHKHLPGHKIIVYDLGLKPLMLEKVAYLNADIDSED